MSELSRFPMNLQLFADSGAENGNAPAGNAGGSGAAQPTQGAATEGGQSPAIDYVRIQQMLDGTLAAKEDTALKAYFKQQGLSQQEVEQAIQTFKTQKAANQPDVGALQAQAAQAQAAVRQAQVENAAILAAVGLGIDAKTIPYLIKMTDLSQVVGQDGKVSDEAVTNALKKTLEDVPGLKPQAAGQGGFIQVGAAASGNQQQTDDAALKAAFGLK